MFEEPCFRLQNRSGSQSERQAETGTDANRFSGKSHVGIHGNGVVPLDSASGYENRSRSLDRISSLNCHIKTTHDAYRTHVIDTVRNEAQG